jgi:transglutaminase/protease-like cytokinesis protein 3
MENRGSLLYKKFTHSLTFLEDWEIYTIVLKTEFEVNIVLQIVQHILMKGERNGKNFYLTL